MDTDTFTIAELSPARTVSVGNQSCSLQRETHCWEGERIQDSGREPGRTARKSGRSGAKQLTAAV